MISRSERNYSMKMEEVCLKKPRSHARRKRLGIKRLKSIASSDENLVVLVPSCESAGSGLVEIDSKDDSNNNNSSKVGDESVIQSFSMSFGASKNDVGSTVGFLVVGGGDQICVGEEEEEEEEDDDLRTLLRCVSHGSVSVCGRRREMEDAVTIVPGLVSDEYDFFAVYDGHGGSGVANVCRDRLHRVLVKEIEGRILLEKRSSGDDDKDQMIVDWENVMVSCFLKMDEEVLSGRWIGVDEEDMKSIGSTAVVALVGRDKIIVANCGDSRAVLSRGGAAVPLSRDHRPDRSDEMERVEAAGGRVINWNGYRVLGVLATSRSIGDHYLKPYVISEPEVTITARSERDEFLILASDGLWDVLSNEVACDVARRCLQQQQQQGRIVGTTRRRRRRRLISPSSSRSSTAADAAAVLVELAMSRGSEDNVSVVIIELNG